MSSQEAAYNYSNPHLKRTIKSLTNMDITEGGTDTSFQDYLNSISGNFETLNLEESKVGSSDPVHTQTDDEYVEYEPTGGSSTSITDYMLDVNYEMVGGTDKLAAVSVNNTNDDNSYMGDGISDNSDNSDNEIDGGKDNNDIAHLLTVSSDNDNESDNEIDTEMSGGVEHLLTIGGSDSDNESIQDGGANASDSEEEIVKKKPVKKAKKAVNKPIKKPVKSNLMNRVETMGGFNNNNSVWDFVI